MKPRSVALVVAALIAACSKRDGSVPSQPTPPPPPEAAIPEPTPPAPEAALKFVVIREDNASIGIASDVKKLDSRNEETWFATVPDSGQVTVAQACAPSDRFQVDPVVPDFMRGPPQQCASTITFKLFSTQTTMALIQKADEAARGGDLMVAQANYGLAAERIQFAKPTEAAHFRVLAATAAGRVLGVQNPIEVVNGVEAPSPEFKKKLEDYQRSAKLPTSGLLDAPTREAISKIPRSQLLERASQTPPIAVEPKRLESTVDVRRLREVQMTPANEAVLRNRSAEIRQLEQSKRVRPGPN